MIKKLFSIKGRMNRLEYFLYTLVLAVIFVLVQYKINDSAGLYYNRSEYHLLIIVAFIILFFFTIFSIKRLHDMGYSGKLIILPYLIIFQVSLGDSMRGSFTLSNILNVILWLVLILFPPKNEENKFG